MPVTLTPFFVGTKPQSPRGCSPPFLVPPTPTMRTSMGYAPGAAALLPPRPPTPSRSPLWAVVLFISLLLNGAIFAVYISFKNDARDLYVGCALAFAAFVPAIVCAVSLYRTHTIHDVLIQDPDVVCQDRESMLQLAKLPMVGTKEVDRLQVAIYTVMCALRAMRREQRNSLAGARPGVSRLSTGVLQRHNRALGGADGVAVAGALPLEDADDALDDEDQSYATAESFEDNVDARLLGFRSQSQQGGGRPSGLEAGGSGRPSPSPFNPSGYFSAQGDGSSAASTAPKKGLLPSSGSSMAGDAGVAIGSYGAVSLRGETVSAITDDDGDYQRDVLAGADDDGVTAPSDDARSLGSVRSVRSKRAGGSAAHQQRSDTAVSAVSIPSVSAATDSRAVSLHTIGGDGSRSASRSASMGRSLFDPLDDNHRGSWTTAMSSIPDPGGPIILQVLRNVQVGSSLSAVTLPVHILESRSLLEKMSDMFVHAELLLDVPAGSTPYERLLRVTKWFLSAYHIRPPGAKNPYNPVLGEVFGCVFNPDQKQRRVRFLAEQVCHHPPVTAMNVDCGTGFAKFFGIMHPRSKLVSLNCAGSIVEGCGVLTLDPSCLADRSGTAAASAAPGGSAAAAHHNTTGGGGSSSAPTLRYSISWPSVFVRAASRWGPCAWSWAVTLSSKTWTPARRCR